MSGRLLHSGAVCGAAAVMVAGAFAGCTFDESLLDVRCTEPGARRGGEVCRDGYWVKQVDVNPRRDTRVPDTRSRPETGPPGDISEDGDAACENGERRRTERTCGSAERGNWIQTCTDGRWSDRACEGGWYRTCDEYLEAHPEAESGEYKLDIDGEGDIAPSTYYCVMADHGWTLVGIDTFEKDAKGWNYRGRTRSCGEWGPFLGGPCKLGNGTVYRDFEIPPVPHDRLLVALKFYRFDTWDRNWGDAAAVGVGNETLWAERLEKGRGTQQCGVTGPEGRDEQIDVAEVTRTGGRGSYRVYARGALDEGPCNESWGIDDVRLLVR